MSGWDTPAPVVEAHSTTEPSQDTTAVNDGSVENQQPEVPAFDPQAHGWAKPEKYDYDAYKSASAAPQGEDGANGDQSSASRGAAPGQAWAANAGRYEYLEEYGDVAPRIEELEKQLFVENPKDRVGDKIQGLEFEVAVESEEKVQPVLQFEDAGLHPVMLENLKLCGYTKAMPIQAYSIPSILTGHDLIAVAQTGSGKTAAFLVPVISKLMGKAKKLAAPRPGPHSTTTGYTAEPLVLIIVPTRELAIQIFDEARKFCYRSMLRPCVAYGGGPIRDQIGELGRGCDILIGTPGRLKDFMQRGSILSLRRVKYTIVDEADEMVGSDWQEDLEFLVSGGDNNEDADHRYLMFSATFPKAAEEMAKKYLDDGHIRIKVGRVGSTHTNIFQHFIEAAQEKKKDCLRDLIRSCDPVRTIIFVNNKRAADEIDDFLYNQGFPSTSIHSDRTQREREDALNAFRSGHAPILVTTGVTARGLDIFDVGHVINYDLPKADHGGIDEYVHRIGRTGRIGHVGVSTSFWNEGDESITRRLVKLLLENKQAIPEFFKEYMPAEGQELNFDEDEDDYGGAQDTTGDASGGGDGWGEDAAADNGAAANGASDTNGWEEPAAPPPAAPVNDDDGW